MDPFIVGSLITAGGGLLGGALDFFSDSEDRDLAQDQLASQERIALQKLGLQEEEIENLEKQRGFERLIKMVGSGNTLMNQASGAQRLTNIRNAGTSKISRRSSPVIRGNTSGAMSLVGTKPRPAGPMYTGTFG